MAATLLDAIQNIATQGMIDAAKSTLGINEQAATSTLGASVLSLLGSLIKRSGDAGVMGTVASLVNGLGNDTPSFANMTEILAGGPPVSASQVAGNKLLGAAFGDKSAASIAAISFATNVSPQAASGLTTLAAPIVLAALRSKLGGASTGADVVKILKDNEGVVASNMPAALRNFYGFAAAAAPAAAAAVAAVAPSVAAAAPPPVAAAPAAVKPAAPPTPAPAPVVSTAAKPSNDVLKSGSSYATAAGTAAAPAAAAAKPAAPPAAPAPAPMARPVADEGSDFDLLPFARIALPLLFLGVMGWLWYHIATQPPAPKPAAAAPAATAPAPAAPKPAAPAPAPAAAPAPAPAPAVTTSAGANGLVKYTLPGGASFEAAKDGVEAKLIGFITDKSAAIDNKLWFDFDHLSFVTGSSELSPESKDQVAAVAAILKAFPAAAVKIGGYTDNQGDPDANLKLSDARANSVMAAIVAAGVAGDRVEAKGYGDQFPVGDNGTPEGRAKNRRTALSVRSK